MDADEKTLLEAARACDECVPWLEHCHAECCREFTFRVEGLEKLDRTQKELRIRAEMTDDLRYYVDLHGARIEDDTIMVPMDRCTLEEDIVHVAMECTALQEDCLCSLHPDRKPQICKDLTLEAARGEDYWTPAECLFTYKMKIEETESEG